MKYNFKTAWPERCKQILKKWRALPNETKAPYLIQARDNRATVRMKKTQQVRTLFPPFKTILKKESDKKIYQNFPQQIRI